MKLKEYLELTNQQKHREFMSTLSKTNRTPKYFVNWNKVQSKTKLYENELNELNSLVGKENIKEEARKLFTKKPNLLKAVPSLIASREQNLEIMMKEDDEYITEEINFSNYELSKIEKYLDFMEKSGLFRFLRTSIKSSLVDFLYGVETGLDSNARKNRSGSTMEEIVNEFVNDACNSHIGRFEIFEQVSPTFAKNQWNIDIPVDKSARRFDLGIFDKKDSHLYLIETNFYGGGGSKLKSVAGEFSQLNNLISTVPNISFIWITDGQGWHTTHIPLAEAFDKIKYIFNLNMLKKDFLKDLITKKYLK